MAMRANASGSGRRGRRPDIDAHLRAVKQTANSFGMYDYIARLDRFRHRLSGDLLRERALLNLLGGTIPIGVSAEQALYTTALGVRQYAGLTFAPGQPADLMVNGQLELNVWTPPDIVPLEGDPAPFLELVNHLYDHDPIAIDYTLDVFACLVQKPGTKLNSMSVLIGGQGVGKSLLLDMLAELVGRRNVAFPTAELMRSSFTGWLLNASLIVVHELPRADRELATRLKHWVTASELMVNVKGVPEFTIRNYANILACSNDEGVAQLDADDRRVFAWVSQARPKPPSDYEVLVRWFEDGGTRVVLHYLLSRDIGAFNPKAPPPATPGRTRLIENARCEAENFLRDALESFTPPFAMDLVTASEVLQYLRAHQIRCTDAQVRRFLRDAGALPLGQHRIRGARPNLWAVRNPQQWASAAHDVLAAEYVPVFDQAALMRQRSAETANSLPMPRRRRAEEAVPPDGDPPTATGDCDGAGD